MFSYGKPILSAEREQTKVISAQACSEMANTKTFVTPQSHKSEAIAIPGQTYIMEFKVGLQTTLDSSIKCKGQDILLDGSIQNGIVQHVKYIVTIESEVFTRTGGNIMAMSLAEKLACNPHGPSTGCVGILHTYIWEMLKTSCLFREVREAQGLVASIYFAAEKEHLFYKLKGSQTHPMSCCGYQVYATNVQDIMLLRMVENKEMKLLPIDWPRECFLRSRYGIPLSFLEVRVRYGRRAEKCSRFSSIL